MSDRMSEMLDRLAKIMAPEEGVGGALWKAQGKFVVAI